MSANVESMMWIGRETPWHGLGVSIEAAPTSEDAIVAAGLDWKVGQRELFLPDGRKARGYKANVRESDNSLLGIVTDRYKVVQNDEAFAFTDTLLGEGVKYETAGSLAGGKRVWMLAILPEEYKVLDDKVAPYFVLTNSHDGKSGIMAAMTPIRVVCQNTLNLALESADRVWKTVHAGNFVSKANEAKMTLRMGDAYMKALSQESWELAKIKMNDREVTEYIKWLLPLGDDAGVIKENNTRMLRDSLWQRYKNAPDLQHVGKNAFRFMNAVSDFATHQAPLRESPNRKESLFASTIDGNVLINKAYKIVQAVA